MFPLASRGLNNVSQWKAPHLKISVKEKEKNMEFLKELLGEKYPEFEKLIKEHNEKEENKDKQIKIANIGSGGYVDKKKYDDAVIERDQYKKQLDTATETLKGFEGVDPDELTGKVDTLTSDLEEQKKLYESKIADMQFSTKIESALSLAKAKNAKAVMALLDIENLKESKNQDTDLTAAIDAVKEENDFLFESDKEPPVIVRGTKGGAKFKGEKMSLEEAMKYANEHPDVDVSTLI